MSVVKGKIAREGTRRRADRLSPEARRQQIVAAALHVVAEQGLGHTSQTMVSQRATVSLPTIVHYFPEHEALVDAVLSEVSAYLLDGLAVQIANDVADPFDALEEMLTGLGRAMDIRIDIMRIWLDWSTATRHPSWERYLQFRSKACDIVEEKLRVGQRLGALRGDLDIDEAAQVIVGVGHMVAQMRFTGSSLQATRTAVRNILSRYLRPEPA